MTFNLPTGRQVTRDAAYCVAVKTHNRWNHQFFKSYKGASNEIKRLRSYSADTVAYYDIQEYKLIKGI